MSKFTRRDAIQTICRILPAGALAQWLRAENTTPSLQERLFSVPTVDQDGKISARFAASSRYFPEDLGSGVALEMASIPGGSFNMGAVFAPLIGDSLAQPVHHVSVAPFFLGTYAVTRGQWRRVSTFAKITSDLHAIYPLGMPLDIENQLPIDVVFYYEAIEFCARLQNYTGRPYRLPSEAEWEYACRAGTTTNYHFGDFISLQVANYDDLQRPLSLTPVGSKQAPNRFGLHDMHGNVLEWCNDWVHADYSGAPSDGSPWIDSGDSTSRVTRGGMYLWGPESARSGERGPWHLRDSVSGLGFRVALWSSSDFLDPQFGALGLVSAGALSAGAVSPGEIVSIFGINIGPSEPVSLTLDASGRVATRLAGEQVLFDGTPAPLLYVSRNQINAIVPYGVAGKITTQVMINSQGQTSAPVTIPVSAVTPAIFTLDDSGHGQGAILNEDGSLNSARNPAARGSIVTLFGTGEGQTNPGGVDGKIAAQPLPIPIQQVRVTIAGADASVEYAGAAPREVAGLLQVNAKVPSSIPPGDQPVILTIGQTRSQNGVTMVVR